MSVEQENARPGTSRGGKFETCHGKIRWNRIESSSDGSDDEVIASSQESPQLSGIARKIFLSYNSRRSRTLSQLPAKSTQEGNQSDLEDVPEDPIEMQPKEFGRCPRGAKRMPPLDCIVQTLGMKKGFAKRRLELTSAAERGSVVKKTKVQSNSEEQRDLVSLIDNDSSESDQETVKEKPPPALASKKFVKTPSTTIEWDESPVDSGDDFTIDSVPEVEEQSTPVVFTRIVVDEVSVYYGLSFINCIVNGENSIVLVRPLKGVTLKKGQILEVDLPGNPHRVKNDIIYIVDRHRIVNTL